LISLGVDQSTTKTGMCLIEFDKKFKWEFIKATTVETSDYGNMKVWMLAMIINPAVVCAEWGYVGKNIQSAFQTIRTSGWCEAVTNEFWREAKFFTASAAEWRNLIWYQGAGFMNRADAKKFSIDFLLKSTYLSKVKPEKPDDHQGDALGLALYGMHKYLEATL